MIWFQLNAFTPHASQFGGSGSVVADSTFIFPLVVGVRVCPMFCCAVLCFLSSFAILSMGKRELDDLLCCLPGVL